jgi:hypothetical protein
MVEVGYCLTDHGPEVWTKTAVFPMSEWDGQVDHIHLVRVEHFVPQPRLGIDQLLAENVHDIRWWPPAELAASEATFSPRRLPVLLEDLLAGAVPDEPIPLTGF